MVQFLQVGRLGQALILLGLVLYVSSISLSLVFLVLYITFCRCILFCLLNKLAWWDLPMTEWDVKPYYTYYTYRRWTVILGVMTMGDVMWENMLPKPPKVA